MKLYFSDLKKKVINKKQEKNKLNNNIKKQNQIKNIKDKIESNIKKGEILLN